MKVIISTSAKKIPFSGELKKTRDNFVYINVPDKLMDGLFSCMKQKANIPPYRNKNFNNVGAHISVISSDEYEKNELGKIKELGQEYTFYLNEVQSVNPQGWDGMEQVWFLSVDSPDLEKLRKRYGLSEKIKRHDFHITFGVKKS